VEEKIGEGLMRIGAITRDQVEEVLLRQRAGDDRLFGEIAIDLGLINEQALKSYLNVKTDCRFQVDCHFYRIREMTASTLRLKERYCERWPETCAIYQRKLEGKPITSRLRPTGSYR